ncbi:hypothetical protein XNC1_2609 [Xenorhabdus nematophila ATCC 19061]|uniref:Uncharacterized protein n=1 Tax=Xenorhabdus nematophila (strain ATCC 19061 / DSM 3370 / CCUG 14189 / LMG 1036 / NCIMB 9965 / AN6) TaxID=406817 RepID=D3VHL8_XENNA|nr:hypothetical protein XNC1_2609 [Xenorhabdus nematophila ATCC 19061]
MCHASIRALSFGLLSDEFSWLVTLANVSEKSSIFNDEWYRSRERSS